MESRSFQCNISGKDLIIEAGKLAEQANAAVTVKYGETLVLVTACFSKEPREGAAGKGHAGRGALLGFSANRPSVNRF